MHQRDADSRFGMQHAAGALLATVLLTAAAGKVFFLPVESRLGVFSYPGVLASVVLLEVSAAAWLFFLAVRRPRVTRFGGTALFGAFAVYSLWAWLRGEPCQCFGQAAISPLVPLAIDAMAISLLWMPRVLCRAGFQPVFRAVPTCESAGGGGLRGLLGSALLLLA
jgi:hypothetical protein